jgi:hypothetical protein
VRLNKICKKKQFQAFEKILSELKKEDRPQEFIDSFLRSYVTNYTSEFLDKERSPWKAPEKGIIHQPAKPQR